MTETEEKPGQAEQLRNGDSAAFPVVGIGASAGGINALQTLLKTIPAEPHLAFVIVQHLPPDQRSQLASLMSKWTSLPVRQADHGMALEQDTIYVAPPGEALTIEGGVFATKPLDRASTHLGIDTIDSFFDSLAADFGRRAVAVVLSGTGADGAAGAVRIKQAGGMVLVQDPVTAMHDGMPKAAIAGGVADRIMSLGALALELVACASPDYVRASRALWADDITKALDGIIDLVVRRAGFDLSGYKTTPLVWRIQRRMEQRLVGLFRDYEALLHDDPAELDTLIRGIPIHVTEFFRNPKAWEALESRVIPHLFDDAADEPLRAWTPACATGEEAYSLAMLLAEQAEKRETAVGFQVFATDAAPQIVARASRGIFPSAAMQVLTPQRQQRFFYAVDGAVRVSRTLRERMVFAPQDLLADPPFSGLDLVTCRNLLIYLERPTVDRVIYLLHSSLRSGGYLFLGKGESLSPKHTGFEEFVPGTRIYRKVGPLAKVEVECPKRPARLHSSRSGRSVIEAHAHEITVETEELPAVLVDERLQIIHFYGDTTPFLRFPPGEPTLNLLRLMKAGAALETVAHEALSKRSTIAVPALIDPVTGDPTLTIRIAALDAPQEGGRLLVSFMRSEATGGVSRDKAVNLGEALRVSHEELESSREELLALNEELRASNDQLNISNEDLASANTQLENKIREMETQSHVLSSAGVMALFLDEQMRVRWFTPAIDVLFPLRPGDSGRRITDFAPRFNHPPFIGDVQRVMKTGETSESEIPTADGYWYHKRIRPFRTDDSVGASAGVAITFSDITDRKRAQDVLTEEYRNTKILQDLSVRLVSEESNQTVYEEILSAAIELTRAKAGTIQRLDAEAQELIVIASRGFSRKTEDHFVRVDASSSTSCGLALRTGERSYRNFEPDSADASIRLHVADGLLSAQSSPLVSRSGKAIGMISTHWGELDHRLSEPETRSLGLLARQAANLIEQRGGAGGGRNGAARERDEVPLII